MGGERLKCHLSNALPTSSIRDGGSPRWLLSFGGASELADFPSHRSLFFQAARKRKDKHSSVHNQGCDCVFRVSSLAHCFFFASMSFGEEG